MFSSLPRFQTPRRSIDSVLRKREQKLARISILIVIIFIICHSLKNIPTLFEIFGKDPRVSWHKNGGQFHITKYKKMHLIAKCFSMFPYVLKFSWLDIFFWVSTAASTFLFTALETAERYLDSYSASLEEATKKIQVQLCLCEWDFCDHWL